MTVVPKTSTLLVKSTTTRLKTFVLPTLHNQHIFHPRFLKPLHTIETSILLTSFIIRKWRFQLSDIGAYLWHSFGHRSVKSPWMNRLYLLGNKMTSRNASDEYFFKMIPKRTKEVHTVFVFPWSI